MLFTLFDPQRLFILLFTKEQTHHNDKIDKQQQRQNSKKNTLKEKTTLQTFQKRNDEAVYTLTSK